MDAELPTEDVAAHDAKTILDTYTKPAMLAHKKKKADTEATTKACLNHSKEHVPQVLSMSKTLQDLGQWNRIPGRGEICLHFSDARMACLSSSSPLQSLATSWHERHRGILTATSNRQRHVGLRGSLCWQAGVCHCGRTDNGLLLKKMWVAMRGSMRDIFGHKMLVDALVAGLCAMIFTGVSSDEIVRPVHRCVAIPLHYLKPWRPTFLELSPFSAEDALLLNKLFPTLTAVDFDELQFMTMTVEEDDAGEPRFLTALEFAQSLDPLLSWKMRVAWLSDSAAPFVNSSGKCRVVLRPKDKDVVWWKAAGFDAGNDDDDDDEALLRVLEGQGPRSRPSKFEPQEEVEEDNEGVDEENVDIEDPVATDLNHFNDCLLRLWDDLIDDAKADEETAKDDDSPKMKKEEGAKVKDASSRSSSSSSSSSSQDSSARDKTKVLGTTRDKSHTQAYGMHSLTERYVNGVLTRYQLRCGYPGHDKCTKELANTVTGSSEATRRVLKAWSLLSSLYSNRKDHMSVKQDLIDALRSGNLLSETALDEITMATKDADIEGPFLQAHDLSSQARPRKGLLGKRGENVPADVHQTMEQWCLEGRIPVSSLAQRERQRIVSNTRYEIPAPLAPALRHGYISPNLPPPRGMVWVCRAATWRLRPCGG